MPPRGTAQDLIEVPMRCLSIIIYPREA